MSLMQLNCLECEPQIKRLSYTAMACLRAVCHGRVSCRHPDRHGSISCSYSLVICLPCHQVEGYGGAIIITIAGKAILSYCGDGGDGDVCDDDGDGDDGQASVLQLGQSTGFSSRLSDRLRHAVNDCPD